MPRAFLLPRLQERGVRKIVGARIEAFLPDGAAFSRGRKENPGIFDTIVLAMGVRICNPLGDQLKELVREIYIASDAEHGGPRNHATETGLAAALAL